MLHNVLLMYTYWEKPHQYTIKINDRCLKEIKIWLNVGVNMIKETDKGIIVLSGLVNSYYFLKISSKQQYTGVSKEKTIRTNLQFPLRQSTSVNDEETHFC